MPSMLSEIVAFENLAQIDREILKEADIFVNALKKSQYSIKTDSNNSYYKLSQLDLNKKDQILKYLKITNSISSQFFNQLNPAREEYPEKNLIYQALNFFKLNLKDEQFWKEVDFTDTVEIYDVNGYQVFRTFNFFDTTGYSLMDILTNEWYVLWERPKYVMSGMLEQAADVLSGKRGFSKMNLPPHIVKEVYSGTDALDFIPRSLMVEFGHVCPLYKDDGRIDGFILNSKVKIHTMGESETKKVFMI